ncbi:MAG: hypothetical protein HZA51_17915 [Planctomycetes bacterium]|nr:hypothetical protein [Planctomycetota bacterium]
MPDISYFSVILRFLHILAAITAVGGTIFAAFVVLPATETIPDAARPHFHEGVRRRASKLVMMAIAFLLLSGFYNYVVNEIPAHKGQQAYHMLMGVKILLAFVVFFLASALTGRSSAFAKLREKRKRWMRLQILASLGVVLVGSFLRAM